MLSDYIPVLSALLVVAQGVVGLAVILGALLLLVLGTDRDTPQVVRWPIIGLLCWGIWFVYIAYEGYHDSPPAIAFALAVAVVVLKYGRQIRGILDGETWWPKAGRPRKRKPRDSQATAR